MINYERDLQLVMFDDADAQRRYLQRLESRCFEQLMASNPRTVDALEAVYDRVRAALVGFDAAEHAERVRARKMEV